MRIQLLDQKTKTIKVVPEILDDLWHLEQVIETGDCVIGSSDRKIKGKDEQQKSERIRLFLKIEAETIEFHSFSGVLRVNGIIVEGKPEELVQLKAHHSLEIGLGESIKIEKKEWKQHQIERLKKAVEAAKREKTVLCVLDDENASFALLKEFDLEMKGIIHAPKSGKRFAEENGQENKYLDEVIAKLKELKPGNAVIAGPGFTKENLQKRIKNHSPLPFPVFFESTNSTGITGLNELVKSGSLEKIVQKTQIAKDSRLMEEFLKEIGKETGLAAYGVQEVTEAIQASAVKDLLVLDSLLREKSRETEPLLQQAEKQKAVVHIFNSQSEPGKKLAGFGGMVAILKFKLKW
jgi:protein pelota